MTMINKMVELDNKGIDYEVWFENTLVEIGDGYRKFHTWDSENGHQVYTVEQV